MAYETGSTRFQPAAKLEATPSPSFQQGDLLLDGTTKYKVDAVDSEGVYLYQSDGKGAWVPAFNDEPVPLETLARMKKVSDIEFNYNYNQAQAGIDKAVLAPKRMEEAQSRLHGPDEINNAFQRIDNQRIDEGLLYNELPHRSAAEQREDMANRETGIIIADMEAAEQRLDNAVEELRQLENQMGKQAIKNGFFSRAWSKITGRQSAIENKVAALRKEIALLESAGVVKPELAVEKDWFETGDLENAQARQTEIARIFTAFEKRPSIIQESKKGFMTSLANTGKLAFAGGVLASIFMLGRESYSAMQAAPEAYKSLGEYAAQAYNNTQHAQDSKNDLAQR